MAIEKGLYAAPDGIEELGESEEGMSIEIVDPEMVTLSDGSMEVTIIPDSNIGDMTEFGANLAEFLEDNQLSVLANDMVGLVESDTDARKEWAETFVAGLDLIGLKIEERSQPFQSACGVYSTVLSEAAIRFQAEAMSETFPAAGPVRTKVIGQEDKETLEAADRVKADMNYELTEKMVEYRSEHERLLYSLGLAGSAFKKVYFDPNLGRQVAIYIPAEDVIVPYGASNIESAERVTHIMRKTKNELRKLQASGFYREVELQEPQPYHSDIEERKAKDNGFSLTDDDRYALYEIHVTTTIEGIDDEEDIARPYVITVEQGSNTVLAIRRNWNQDDPLELKRQHFVHYVYVPGFGFYGMGLIHIVGGYAKAGTSIIRQLVDAGTLSNLPAGLKTRGLRVKGDDTPIEPGEFKDVDVPSGSIKDNIMPLPYKEPSQTLLQLLDKITTEGRRLGAISDMNISDMSTNAPVGTTLALLERTLKPMAAVQARVHYAMKQEFKLLKAIMAEHAESEYGYQPNRGEVSARQMDYDMVDVIPVSDPNSSTMAQRVVQYQAVLQMAQQSPQIYNLPQLHRQMIEVLGIKNADKLVPTEDDAEPLDPISENMNALMGKPLKAFIYQDHAAHITAHETFMKDPMIAQAIGQNPQAQRIMAALQAHVAEHYAFLYREQIEEKLGVPLPAPNKPLPPEIEVTMSQVMAQAGEKVTQAHIMQKQQMEAQQKAQDPVIQMQQQEMAMKAQELQQKAEKDSIDAQLKIAEQERKQKGDVVDTVMDLKKLELEEKELQLEAEKAGIKLSLDTELAKSKLSMDTAKLIQDNTKE
tara:strand:- start:1521 stop:3968 length:2448 start_codon:yes stop_codon:yes gene_type:complete